jgi:hypothetical protein
MHDVEENEAEVVLLDCGIWKELIRCLERIECWNADGTKSKPWVNATRVGKQHEADQNRDKRPRDRFDCFYWAPGIFSARHGRGDRSVGRLNRFFLSRYCAMLPA